MKKTLLVISVIIVSIAIMGLSSSAFAWGSHHRHPSDTGQVGRHHSYKGDDQEQTATKVPEPATLILLGVGLAGLATISRKKIK